MAVGSKQRILEASKDLFYRHGYMATSVDDIIADAKVAKSNFYYHFKTKEDLGIAVLEQRCSEFELRRATTLCNDDLSPRDRLICFLKALGEKHEGESGSGCPFGNLIAEMADHNERFRHFLSDLFQNLLRLVTDVIAEGQIIGQFRRDVPAPGLAAVVVHMIQGAHLLQKCHRSRDEYVQSVEVLIKLISDRSAAAR